MSDAAHAAIAMQRCMRGIDLAKQGLPPTLNLRIGAHFGPITFAKDPITGRQTAYGSQVSQAAKIEACTVPGSVFVSDAFAAALALSPDQKFTTSYVGKHTLGTLEGGVRLFALVPSATAK